MEARIATFVSRRWSVPGSLLRITLEPLRGGLESAVARARLAVDASHPLMPHSIVIKELAPGLHREADVYAWLWRNVEQPPAVRVFGQDRVAGTMYLFLEDARACSPWPWSDTASAAAVCCRLARYHDSAVLPADELSWDYESELARSAAATLELAGDARDVTGRRYWRRLGDLRRVVAALPAIRAHLMTHEKTLIHGDVHPGNTCLRERGRDPDVVLIDWARARVGSPMEDVASWLHSLGCWEPQARRRHDTLIRAYLASRRVPRRFEADVRLDYWLASASNGLSGAIRYHLAVLGHANADEAARDNSRVALAAWERVVRRVAALVNTSPGRCT